MKVLLINPTSYFEVIGNNPSALESSRGYSPPLGLLLLAGYLRDHTNHSVKIIDAQASELTWQQIGDHIEKFKPDVVGLTVMTQTLIDSMRVVEIVKARSSSSKIVLGGPHVHLFPNETIELPGVDYLILGEGEIPFSALLNGLESKSSLESIKGLVFKHRSKIINTGFPELIRDMDALSFPARELLDVNLYDSVLLQRTPVTTMFTSRGCPYACSFCDRPHLGKRFRARSAENVLEEFEQCIAMGIRDFLIYDDTFTVKRQRVMDICQGIIDRKLDINFDVRARVDTVDREMLELMKRAGCKGIHYGVEAGTEKILKVLRKGITLKQVEEIFALTKQIGIKTLAYFMIGSPTETLEDIYQTFKFAKQISPDFFHLAVLTPFPGTQLYAQALSSGVIETDVWREFAANPHMGFVPPFWKENFTLEELNDLLIKGYKKFYRRPSYLFQRILDVRSKEELYKKAKAGFKLLTMKNK